MDDRRRCTAKSKRSGERCKRAAIRGGTVCSIHGGKIPAVVANAGRRLALAEATEFVAGEVEVRGPMTLAEVYEELLRTAQLAVQWRDLLEQVVARLEGEWRYEALGIGTEQLRSEVALFERAMTRAAKILELIARLDIEARAARLSASQGDQVAAALRRAVERAQVSVGVTDEQARAIFDGLAVELRRIGEAG